MSDPVRWRRGDAPPGASDLLAAARRTRPLDPDARSRSAQRVARLAAVPVATSAAVMWAKGLAAAAGIGLAGALAVGVVVARASSPAPTARVATPAPPAAPSTHAGTSAARATTARHDEPRAVPSRPVATLGTPTPVASGASVTRFTHAPLAARPRNNSTAQAPAANAVATIAPTQPAPAPPAITPPAPSATIGTAAPSGVPAPAPAVHQDPLAAEAELLELARASLAADPRAALDRIDAHTAAFPHGQLVAEREFLAVEALRRLGRTADARARAEAFLARFPRHTSAPRVRRALEALPQDR